MNDAPSATPARHNWAIDPVALAAELIRRPSVTPKDEGALVHQQMRDMQVIGPADHAVVVEGEKLRHAGLVEPVKVELGIAGEQIDVEVRVGIPLDEGGAGNAGAVGDQFVEARLGCLDRPEARRQTVEGGFELGGKSFRYQRT